MPPPTTPTEPATQPIDVQVINCTRDDCPPPIHVDVIISDGRTVDQRIAAHLIQDGTIDIYFYFVGRFLPPIPEPGGRFAPLLTSIVHLPRTLPSWKRGYTRLQWSDVKLTRRGIKLGFDFELGMPKKEHPIVAEVFVHGRDPERDLPIGRAMSLTNARIRGMGHLRTKRARK